MAKYKNLLLLVAYLILLKLLYSVPKSTSEYVVASWLGWKFWVPVIIFFVMGFLGIRKGTTIDGETWRGTRFTAFVDEGAVSGTDGIRGGVALSLAYMSFMIVAGALNVWYLKNAIGGVSGGTLLLIDVIMFALMLPFYFLFLYLLKIQKPIQWIICVLWASFLLYAAHI